MVAIISSKSSYLSVPALNLFEKRREEERGWGEGKEGETLWGKWRLEWGQGMAFITYGKEKKEAVAKKLREGEEKKKIFRVINELCGDRRRKKMKEEQTE